MISTILRERGVPEHMIDYSPDPFHWMIPPQGILAYSMQDMEYPRLLEIRKI